MAVTLAGTGQSLDNSLPTLIDARFRILTDDKGVIKNTASKYELAPGTGSTKNLVNYRRVQASQLQDGVDLAQSQTLQDDLTSWGPTEAGVQIVIGGRTRSRVADRDIVGNASEVAANAYDLLEDQLGIAALASFTGSAAMGAAGTVMSPGIGAAGFTRLGVGDNRTNPEPAPLPWYVVLHPYSILPLWGRMIPLATTPQGATAYGVNTGAHAGVSIAAGSDSDSNSMLKKGIGAVGMLAGGMVKRDANFTIDANDDYSTAFYSEKGLLYLSEEEARMDADTSDKSQRGSVELNFWGSFGFTVYRPAAYGIPLTVDASTPTS